MENYKNSKIGRETAQRYGDILEVERPQTEESLRKHPRMTLQNRAKIFSPFSPLRGYDEQLAAEKRRTERVTKRILTEEEMSALSDRLMQVTKGMTITVRYFKEDTAHPEIPAVGNYITLTGKADRIDPVFRTLQVGDTVVPDYGYFGKGDTGYAQYMTAFNRNFGGSSGGGGGGNHNNGGGGDGSGCGCLIAIAVVVVLVLIAMGS